jgi:hypothetical protein
LNADREVPAGGLFFLFVATYDFEGHAIDITNAFVQGELSEGIHMSQPPGHSDNTSRACRLRKSLY